MDSILDFLAPLPIVLRVVVVFAAFAGGFALLVWLTTFLTGLREAMVLWFTVVAVAMGAAFLLPIYTASIVSQPRPAQTYEEALGRFAIEKTREPTPLNPLCDPYILGHGKKTPVAVVLIHGVSSCPRAFVDFAPLLFDAGYNVLVVRMPQNGFADRATDALKGITAEELAAFGDSSVDIAAGLGEEVYVLGISAGGTVAAWTAQTRPEVTRAMLVAPFFGLHAVPAWFNVYVTRALVSLPNLSVWKDPVLKEGFVGMPHAYQRMATRGIGEIMRLGRAVELFAQTTAPAAPEIVVVTNAADEAVNNAVTDEVVATWAQWPRAIYSYEFPASHQLGHELIDPMEPGADPALTYPIILDLLMSPGPGEGNGDAAAPQEDRPNP